VKSSQGEVVTRWTRHKSEKTRQWTRHLWRVHRVTSSLAPAELILWVLVICGNSACEIWKVICERRCRMTVTLTVAVTLISNPQCVFRIWLYAYYQHGVWWSARSGLHKIANEVFLRVRVRVGIRLAISCGPLRAFFTRPPTRSFLEIRVFVLISSFSKFRSSTV